MALTGRTIVTDALIDLGVIAAGETPSAKVAQTALSHLSRIVDNWNAQREAVFATQFLTFTFVPGLNPHTIGPSGATWTVATSRPVTIEGATVVLTPGANQVNAPQMRLHDQSAGIPQWFQSLPTPTLATSYPTDGYYDPTWPSGSFYLWPVPSTAYDCQIQIRQVLADYELTTTFSMPPGYRDALTLTLEEESSEAFGKALSGSIIVRAARARARIFANNTGGGVIDTQDYGMPVRRTGKRSTFNYLTGLNNSGRS